MQQSTTSKEMTRRIALISVYMSFITWMAVKLPMPALPHLAEVFHSSSQVFKVSITLNLIGFSISQIFWGPISDRYGRKPATMAAFGLAIIGSLLAMLAMNISMYIAGRIIEGFAVGSSAPIGRAMFADRFDKITMAKVYSWYAIAAILPPAVGPVIGGYILVGLGWRYIFAFFLILAITYLWFCHRYLPETLTNKADKIRLGEIKQKILHITRSYRFWMYALIYAFINGYMIAYYAAMPFWYVVHFHMREDTYAWLAFLPIASYILGSMLTNRLLHRFTMDQLVIFGIAICLSVSTAMIVLALVTTPTLAIINLLMIIFSVASGIVTPMANTSLIHAFRDKVSILSAIMSGVRVAGAGLLVLISTNINLSTFWPLTLYTSTLSLAALASFIFFQQLAKRQTS